MASLNTNSEQCPVVAANITPKWLGGMYDGDGSMYVNHNHSKARTVLVLDLTQSKSESLLKLKYPGVFNPPQLVWQSNRNIQHVYIPLKRCTIIKKQKLNTMLQHMFHVDISQLLIEGKGRGKAFTVPILEEEHSGGWTAVRWREYLKGEQCLP